MALGHGETAHAPGQTKPIRAPLVHLYLAHRLAITGTTKPPTVQVKFLSSLMLYCLLPCLVGRVAARDSQAHNLTPASQIAVLEVEQGDRRHPEHFDHRPQAEHQHDLLDTVGGYLKRLASEQHAAPLTTPASLSAASLHPRQPDDKIARPIESSRASERLESARVGGLAGQLSGQLAALVYNERNKQQQLHRLGQLRISRTHSLTRRANLDGGFTGASLATSDAAGQLSAEEKGGQSSSSTDSDLTEPSAISSQEGTDAEAGQNVTCSPDYDDQALIVASGNLTIEQQQQLLAGADSAGLLGAGSSSDEQQAQLLKHRQSQLQHQNQCIQPGSKMIEFITRVITPILFSIIIVVGLVGNILVMLVILEDRKTERELTPTNLLILDLSLADLSFIVFCIPFTGWDYAIGHWVFGSLWCKFNQYLIVVCALSSIYTLVLMSIDRFLAIVYPIECMSYRTSKNMLYAICIKWILILLAASPTVAMHGLLDSPSGPDQFNCRFLSDQYNPLHFQIVFFITSYLFPLILILCLYLSLIIKLWFGTKPHGHKESSKMLESKKKVTWLVAGIVILFALCWCPIQVMLILMRLKSHKITATYITIQVCSHILGYMNSCVNPIVYAFASETFLNSFRRSSFGRFCYSLCFCLKKPNNEGGFQNPNHDKTQAHHLHHRHSHQVDQDPRTVISRAFHSSLPADDSNNCQANNNTTPLLNHSNTSRRYQKQSFGSLGSEEKPSRLSIADSTSSTLSQSPGEPARPGSRPMKQQLVARVDCIGNSQVSHRCEPCYP